MKRVGLLVVALALTGCTQSVGTSTSGPPTPASLAQKIGCTGFTPDTGQIELFVRESGTCQFNEETLTVDTFTNQAGQDNWLKAAAAFGGPGPAVVGDLWIIQTTSTATAEMVKSKLGGEVK